MLKFLGVASEKANGGHREQCLTTKNDKATENKHHTNTTRRTKKSESARQTLATKMMRVVSELGSTVSQTLDSGLFAEPDPLDGRIRSG